jgi:hypothetical protein
MSSTANARLRIPGVFAGAGRLSPWLDGEWNFTSSSRPLPSGVCIIATSVRTPSSPRCVLHPLDSHVLDGEDYLEEDEQRDAVDAFLDLKAP